jgi:hypothetical protein
MTRAAPPPLASARVAGLLALGSRASRPLRVTTARCSMGSRHSRGQPFATLAHSVFPRSLASLVRLAPGQGHVASMPPTFVGSRAMTRSSLVCVNTLAVQGADSGIVYVVDDDDASVRSSVRNLLPSAGLAVSRSPTRSSFLQARVARPSCLVLAVGLPGVSGPDLQRELCERGGLPPRWNMHRTPSHRAAHRSHDGCRDRTRLEGRRLGEAADAAPQSPSGAGPYGARLVPCVMQSGRGLEGLPRG